VQQLVRAKWLLPPRLAAMCT